MAKRKLTIEQEKQILKLYNEGYLVNDLKLLYGFKTNKSILDIVKRNGGKIRTFQETLGIKNPNRNISFDKINSPYKAYFIGLMLTDGWICKNEFAISMTDKKAIESVCNIFNKKYRIVKKSGNRKIQYRFTMKSERIVNELKRFGIVERKSLTLKPPKLYKSEIKYLSYLIRGIIDGDGWVRKDGGEFFICSMSIDFIKWCKRVLEKYYKFFEINLIKDNKGLYYIRTSDERNMMLLYIHIYYDNFAMDRKRNYLVQRFREHNGRN